MPIHRDPRTDRRRRMLREQAGGADQPLAAERFDAGAAHAPDAGPRKSAGYSQDVRRACGHRLVQLIPVRRRSYTAVCLISLAVPALLLFAHYQIYVSGRWPWWQHPVARAFDASYSQSIAAWLSSHLWLVCLGATVLTFQLRRHKLDDYNGEYRLWFWLVITCLAASLDSTTHLSRLLGLALENWSQLNLGWSGHAVVDATLAALIGMLGLRLCTELKTVPFSLVFWLVGLVAWAASGALAQAELKVDLSIQFRIWLKCALWLGGLTAIWLAALTFLRSTYLEAQRRFLLRGRLAVKPGVPLRERWREAVPRLPALPGWGNSRRTATADGEAATDAEGGRWRSRFGFGRRAVDNEALETAASTGRTKRTTAAAAAVDSDTSARAQSRRADAPVAQGKRDAQADPMTSASVSRDREKADEGKSARRASSGWISWLRPPKDGDDAAEFRKLAQEEKLEARRLQAAERAEAKALRQAERLEQREAARAAKAARTTAKATPQRAAADGTDTGDAAPAGRKWLPQMRVPKLSMPKLSMPRVAKPSLKLPKLRLPSLAALQLKPPRDAAADDERPASIRAVPSNRGLPGTDGGDDAAAPATRPLTKAERKRMRRQQNDAA